MPLPPQLAIGWSPAYNSSVALSLRVVALLAMILGSPCAAQVVINEVLFLTDPASSDPTRAYQWVELYNKGSDPADLSKLTLTNRGAQGGASVLALPAISLPAGAYLTVNFTAGQNQLDFSAGAAAYFSERPDPPFWSAKLDEAALYDGDKIIDFLAWSSDPTTFDPGAAHDAAVAAKIWPKGRFISISGITHAVYEGLRTLYPGASIGRDMQSTVTRSPDDFDAHGGADALGNTPGVQNFGATSFDTSPDTPAAEINGGKSPKAADAPAVKEWSILLYFAADSNIKEPIIQQMIQIAQGGGTSADVNFLLLLDVPGEPTRRGILRGINSVSGRVIFDPLPGESLQLGSLNTGDPKTLSDFILWSKTNFPAKRSALVISTHGHGWKGISPDTTSGNPPKDPADWLRMGELSQALAGTKFELIALHACLTGAVEVASQLQPFANYLFASEEVIKMGTFPYTEIAGELRKNPTQDGKTFSNFVFDNALLRVQGKSAALGSLFSANDYTLSLTDLTQLRPLEQSIDTWAKQLRTGVGLLQARNNPDDNVQIRLKMDRQVPMRFADDNYVDIDEFASRVLADAGIPACVKTEIPNLQKALRAAVVREAHGSLYPNARGLHIHFPKMRTGPLPPYSAFGGSFVPDPYDAAKTRLTDAFSRVAAYAPNLESKLPFKARNEEADDGNLTAADELKAPVEWPRMPSPAFNFITSVKNWPSFLARYYAPVADNSIIKAVGPLGENLEIKDAPGGACENSIMSAGGPVGSTFTFSARGSSDADMPAGINPLWYFWDLDATKPCTDKCIAPTEVPAGADAAANSTDNKDQDIDPANSTIDDRDADGVQTTVKCLVPGQITTTLIPWDDNHTFRLHNTTPGPAYVHPQTDFDQSYVGCAEPYTPTYWTPQFFYAAYTVILPVELKKGDSPAPGVTGTTDGTGATVTPKSGGILSAASPVTTDKFGMAYLLVQPAAAGLNSLTVTFPGSMPQKFAFNTLRPNDPAGTGLDLSGPSSLTLNRAGSLNATVLGQQGAVSMVSFVIKSANARFDDNRQFFNNAGTQAFTGSDGTAQVSITPTAGGVVEILATTASVSKTLLIPVTGGAPPADTLTLSALPQKLANNATLTLTATLTAGTQAVSGAPVVLQISQGDLTIATAPAKATQFTQTTDAKGQVTFRLTANDTIPAKFSLSATGTKVKKTVDLPVSPSPR